MLDFTGEISWFWIGAALLYGAIYLPILLYSNTLAIYVLLAVATFGNFLADYKLLPDQINWFIEIAIYLVLLKSLLKRKTYPEKRYQIFFPLLLVLFFLITVGSIIYNRSNPISAVLCLRLMFRYVALFIAIINLDLKEPEIIKINKFIVFLILVQLPVALIKFFFYGQGEMAVGTYAGIHGGELSTLLPLIVIPFAIGYYLHTKPSIIYFFISFAFVGYSVIGGKRAFIFYLVLLFIYLFVMFRRHLIRSVTPKVLILLIILILGSCGLATRYINTLNPDKVGLHLHDGHKKGYGAVLEFVWKYNTNKKEGDVATGRISSTLKVFELLNNKGIYGWFFGYGPGSALRSRFTPDLQYTGIPIAYGYTQFNWTAYQFGILGALIYLIIPFRLLIFTRHHYAILKDDYWKAFFFGLNSFCFIVLLDGFTYSTRLVGDFFPCIFFYLAAIAVTKTEFTHKESTLSNH